MSGYKKLSNPAMEGPVDQTHEADGSTQHPPAFRAMGYDAQVQALSPLQRKPTDGAGPAAAERDKEPATLKIFEHVWRRFMVEMTEADYGKEKHVFKLIDLAIDVKDAAAADKRAGWTKEQLGKAARACDKARKAFFEWRSDAQRAGIDKSVLRAAMRANRYLVTTRNELRAAQ